MLDKFSQYISTMKFLFFIFIYLFYLISKSSSSRISNEQLSVDKRDSFNETNIFLDYIFNKYGSNGKISYEGFEHLLENLGLGQLKFEKEHTLDEHKLENGNFEEVHDKLNLHKHNHTEDKKFRSERSSGDSHNLGSLDHDKTEGHRSKLTKITNKHCFTPEEMLVLYNLEPNHEVGISPTNFLHMCPIIVYELDQKSCSYEREEIRVGHVKVRVESVYYIWLSAIVSVFIISFVGLLGVCIVPLLQKAFFNELLSFLVALAVGTLCGDALLHLLPHAFEKGEDDSENVVILRAGTVFLAIVLFYLVENVLCSTSKNKEVIDEPGEIDAELKAEIQLHEKSMLNDGHNHSHPHAHSQSHGHAHTHRPKTAGSISAVAYMVIMGDGLHNLTDGLAIGAAFSGDIISGFTTAIAVFTHELPHELGDFAVLLQTGMTVSQAVFYNVVSSVLSFIGVAAGILLGNFSSASQWIYCITAGVFLYIALVNLVPEMKRPVGLQKSDIFIQISGILCGGGIMFLIALYEHDLEYLFLQ